MVRSSKLNFLKENMNSDLDDVRRNLSPVSIHGSAMAKEQFSHVIPSHGTGAQFVLDSQLGAPNHIGFI